MLGNPSTDFDCGSLLDTITTTTFTKAQKRWRIAYKAIHFTLYLARDIVPEKRNNVSTIAQKRWRLAYTVIYSSRAILSLVAEIVPKSPDRDRRPPHTVLEIEQIVPHHGFDQTTSRSHLLDIDNTDDSFFPDIDQLKLTEMVKEKDLNELRKFGGIKGLTKALQTDPQNGISGNDKDIILRKTTFGTNTYNKPPLKGLLHFVVEAFRDITILILMGCAALSLGFGIKEHGGQEGWYEGGSIFVAVFVVVAVASLSNLRQESQFDKLSKISNDIEIDVMRDGRRQKISIFDVVVGDVAFLTIGDQIPADGVFLSGHSFQVDESSMTGESDYVEVDSEKNPFLLSGSKIADGYAWMLVTSVGMNTSWGHMMSSIARDSSERTPLQARLDKLTSSIGKAGLSVALLVLLVLLIRYFTGNTNDENGNQEFNGSTTDINDVLNSVVRIVSAAVTIVVVAIPEGLPLAVTLTLAYSMKRMMADQAMVRKLSACETMGSATVILLGIVGLKDPCRPGAKKAIEICRSAGVDIKMITGDNVFTAKAIATECGILGPYDQQGSDGEVLEGVVFRNYTHEERMQKVDRIRVMARSSPFDKLLMVQCLKQKGHVVAVTGDGTNDAPALKEADVGLSMGIQGTEVAKESSDIVILDDDFASVATVVRWGRCVYNNIQKFIQFQLTVNVAALVINFIAAVSAGEVPLTTVQLLWVNLIMDSLGALALATEQPTDELMHKPPVGRTEPLITNIMWRNLLAQALYQIAILLTFQFGGKSIFNVSNAVKNTIIFNTFVFCQVFNEFNSRKLEKKNVFTGLHRNRLFLGIVAVTIVLQIVMVEFLKKFADTVRLNWWQWVVCIAVAAFSWPIAWCVKSIPVSEKPFLSYLRR